MNPVSVGPVGRQGLRVWQKESRGAAGLPGETCTPSTSGKPRTRSSWAEGLERPWKEFPDRSSVPLVIGSDPVGVTPVPAVDMVTAASRGRPPR